MSGVKFRRELLAVTERAARRYPLAPVSSVFLPEPQRSAQSDPEFGVVTLADGSAGLYYAWLGDSQCGLAERFPPAELRNLTALGLARRYASDDEGERSIGLAAINAITAACWRDAGFVPPPARDPWGGEPLAPTETLGFIGNFPSLVRRARSAGVEVVVVERKAHWVHEEPGLKITLDPTALLGCTRIIATATVCLNDSLDDMLAYCAGARSVSVIGPTASFFPDPLFTRGVASVGGLRVLDAVRLMASLRDRDPWQAYAERYTLDPTSYPASLAMQRPAGVPGGAV